MHTASISGYVAEQRDERVNPRLVDSCIRSGRGATERRASSRANGVANHRSATGTPND